ncbi:hypothetical protein [Chondromyces apiculatus]|uniref:Uncharacterized protein n=1 Tax=Chondromyces apiculatus DSM 436 TaxID=1192034 RepID=A0A017T6A4_9BACT|nr:hypothetical protein [Chondromyces apiculatus]EYF04086.1 Hypothetical protein CAP_4769 [Chondromyces apiculatus DSM 436]
MQSSGRSEDGHEKRSGTVGGALLLGVAVLSAIAWRAPHAPDLHPTVAAEAQGAAAAGLAGSILLAGAAVGWMRGRAWAAYVVLPCGLLFFSLAILLVTEGAGVTRTGAALAVQPLMVVVTALGLPLAGAALGRVAVPLSQVRVGRGEGRWMAAVLVISAGLLWFIWGRVAADLVLTGRSTHSYQEAGATSLLWTAALVDTGFSTGCYLAGAWLLLRGGRAAAPAGFVAAAYLAQHMAQAVVIEVHRLVTGVPVRVPLLGVAAVLMGAGVWGAVRLARRAVRHA